MKWLLMIMGIIIVIALITNPGEQQIKERLKEKVYNDYDKRGLLKEDLTHHFLTDPKEAMYQGMLKHVRIKNCYLYSNILFKMSNLDHSIGYGVFGNVYINDSL